MDQTDRRFAGSRVELFMKNGLFIMGEYTLGKNVTVDRTFFKARVDDPKKMASGTAHKLFIENLNTAKMHILELRMVSVWRFEALDKGGDVFGKTYDHLHIATSEITAAWASFADTEEPVLLEKKKENKTNKWVEGINKLKEVTRVRPPKDWA